MCQGKEDFQLMDAITISALIKEEKRRYHKNWRANNPERVRAANARYWQKRAQKLLKQGGDTDNVTCQNENQTSILQNVN